MEITGNEPAMPIVTTPETNEMVTGLTIRQQFAMAAMQGISARNVNYSPAEMSAKAVQYADALINELNKSEQ